MIDSTFSRTRRVFVLAVAGILLFGLSGLPAQAAPQGTVIVTKAADTNDGTCDADCSLREAIAAANPNDAINFAGDYAIVLENGSLVISKSLTIDATGHTVSVSGNDISRVFYIWGSNNVTITHLTITHGYANQNNGGAILAENFVTLTLNDSTVSFSRATYDGGGMRSNNATTTVRNSTFLKNTAGTFGGGIAVVGGSATISGSTFSTNKAINGGAISVDTGSAFVSIANSTFFNQKAPQSGVIYSLEELRLYNTTIYRLKPKPQGYGLYLNGSGHLTMVNSIIAGSFAVGCIKMSGVVLDSAHHNLIQDKTCLKGTTKFLGGDPQLGKLKNNGGPTSTAALPAGSKAINKGDNGTCAAAPVNGVDQRGVTRPTGVRCDLGAYEYAP